METFNTDIIALGSLKLNVKLKKNLNRGPSSGNLTVLFFIEGV